MPKEETKKEEKVLSILERLVEARKIIRETEFKKLGENTYSKYMYFTPEQTEQLVADACEKTNTIVLCNLLRDEYGLYQTLDFIAIDNPKDKLSFSLSTEKGSITATSATQQMGGTDTYSERYIKMKVFQIKDNNLDPDSQDNSASNKTAPKTITKPVVENGKTARNISFG